MEMQDSAKNVSTDIFLKEAFLLPYDEVREEYVERYLKANPTAISGNTVMVLTGVSDDNDDLPF